MTGLRSALKRGEPVRILSETDAALSRLRRALAELCPLLADHFGISCPAVPAKDLEPHLRTRREYGLLRRELADPGLPLEPEEITARILRARELLADLLNRAEIVPMRIDDRVEMRRLLQRIVEWEVSPMVNGDDGARLLEDIIGFVRLLNGINNRQEIIEHDHQTAVEALNALQRSRLDLPPDASIFRLLGALEGRDRTIDSLLLRDPPAPGRDWLFPLHRLTTSLKGGAGQALS